MNGANQLVTVDAGGAQIVSEWCRAGGGEALHKFVGGQGRPPHFQI
jgi:hypothetical protein